MGLLEAAERAGVVCVSFAPAPAEHEAIARLAVELVELSASVNERDVPPRAVVLESGPPTFAVAAPGSAADLHAASPEWAVATAAVARIESPTLAVLRGDAIGPAWELALACDLRLAVADVRVGSPELGWGCMPAAGGTQRLARLVGVGTALRLVLLGEVLLAADAFALGLVHRAPGASEVSACVEEVLASLRSAGPIALTYAKEALHRGVELPLADGLRLEADLAALLQTTRDRAEGLAAFAARRPAHFEGQ
ncbi:MAG: enoyl-CoA hydratase/isomerase family protein [Chloroflexi bacterium]|nr:enoyl-CoA hydratase/isomerase family protein [Chloroflexota bacterium]